MNSRILVSIETDEQAKEARHSPEREGHRVLLKDEELNRPLGFARYGNAEAARRGARALQEAFNQADKIDLKF